MQETHTILEGDCLELMKTFADNHFTSIVTDPPYGLGFMGKEWDAGLPHDLIWKEALRVVKPGGFLLAFGGTRTYHRLTCAIEDAGWEIRDCIMWMYGSGFPKSHNKFGLEGYGTSLKPAYEPIIVAMKPIEGTFANNAEVWGQAGINIDECRVGLMTEKEVARSGRSKKNMFNFETIDWKRDGNLPKGRWPANVILDEEAGDLLDAQSGVLKSGKVGEVNTQSKNQVYSKREKANVNNFAANSGGASRFFYCAKASSKERSSTNNHPTVKPLALMEYLIKLVSPPTNALILDPFAGSGTTILAAKRLSVDATGIEKQPEYVKIARERLQNGELF